ncbi:hypothetical protein RUND412_005994 [Rhizina undulata]
MALFFNCQRRYDDSLQLYQKVPAEWEEALGVDHPSTLIMVDKMASVLYRPGLYEEALELYMYQRALAGREKVLGMDHPTTLTIVDNMALVFHRQGYYNQTLDLYQRALVRREKALGKEHASTLRTGNNIKVLRISQRMYRGAGYHCMLPSRMVFDWIGTKMLNADFNHLHSLVWDGKNIGMI